MAADTTEQLASMTAEPSPMPMKGDDIDIGIPQEERSRIAQGLSRMLADSFQLYMQTHAFHWNVEGPMFNTLHLMFMEQYTELWNALDEIAERIRALGFPSPGGCKAFQSLSTITEVEATAEAMQMVRILVQGHEACVRTAREVLEIADEGGDEPSVDMLTQRLQVHEKTAWMLRSMLK